MKLLWLDNKQFIGMQITREEFPDKIKFKEEIPNALANYDDDMMISHLVVGQEDDILMSPLFLTICNDTEPGLCGEEGVLMSNVKKLQVIDL